MYKSSPLQFMTQFCSNKRLDRTFIMFLPQDCLVQTFIEKYQQSAWEAEALVYNLMLLRFDLFFVALNHIRWVDHQKRSSSFIIFYWYNASESQLVNLNEQLLILCCHFKLTNRAIKIIVWPSHQHFISDPFIYQVVFWQKYKLFLLMLSTCGN